MSNMHYETIIAEKKGRVGLITLNRQKALNAINRQLTQGSHIFLLHQVVWFDDL